MTQTNPTSPSEDQIAPWWKKTLGFLFDVRVIGVLGQMAFIVLVVFVLQTIGGNFAENAERLGKSQFICRDGSFSYRCAFDFMESEAGFDISDTVVDYVNTDPYWRAFGVGILNTLKVGILGVIFTTLLGTAMGIARMSKNWLISKIALWYVELVRNTPLLIQVFFVYFGLILTAPELKNATQPLGLPIFVSRRGLNFPSFEFTSSAAIWLAFLILGIIQIQVTWVMLSRQEERTGKPTNRIQVGLTAFILIVGLGWAVASNVSDTQGFMVSKSSRITNLSDMEKLTLQNAKINHISELDTLSEEELDEAAFQICVLDDSASEANFTRHLRKIGVPYEMNRYDRPDKATKSYVDAKCDIFASTKAILASERSTLESPSSHVIVSVKEAPIVWSLPTQEGLNIKGGSRMKPEFTALLLALVLFYGGALAEIVRAGIMSVSKGQTEAARALGLSEGQRLQLVVLPQALRVIIPPGIGIALSLAKDTSLGMAIGFPDMYAVAFTTSNQSGRVLQLFVLIMIVYMLISLAFSILLNWYNEKIKLVER